MLQLAILIIVAGVVLYCINKFVPMDAKIKNILNVVVVIAVVIFCLQAFGVFSLLDKPVPRVGK